MAVTGGNIIESSQEKQHQTIGGDLLGYALKQAEDFPVKCWLAFEIPQGSSRSSPREYRDRREGTVR